MILGIVLGIPLLLCGGAATWFLTRGAKASAQVDQRVAELQQQGEPVDNETLQSWYQMRTDGSDTFVWVQIGESLETKEYNEASRGLPFHGGFDENGKPTVVPPAGQDWTDRKAVDDFLKRYQNQLETLLNLGLRENAKTGKPVRRPVIFDSFSTLLPDMQRLRAMSRLLQLQHAVAVYDNDRELALKCIKSCRGLHRSTRAEPFMVCHLIGMALAKSHNEMVRLSLQHDQLTDEQMDDISGGLASFQQMHDMYVNSLKGERAMQLSVLLDSATTKEAASQQADMAAEFGGPKPLLLPGTRGIDTLFALETMDSFIDVPDSDPESFIKAVHSAGAALQEQFKDQGFLSKIDHAVSGMLLPAIEPYAKAFVKQFEGNQLAKLAMAVRKYQHQNDRFPQSLDELYRDDASLESLTAADGTEFGFKIEENGDAVLWGGDETPFGDEVPELDAMKSDAKRWIWRLKAQ